MKTNRISIALAILILFCAGCAASSISPVSSTKPIASMMDSPSPSETAASARATVSPTPSPKATDASSIAAPTPSAEPADTGAVATATAIKGVPGLFNEDTYSKYFRFGMSIAAVENELKELKIKITDKTNDDSGHWSVCTDHVLFQFDKNNRLYDIDVTDWETAKGFVPGQSSEILHQLYGKEDEVEYSSSLDYVYAKKDCYFSVEIADVGGSDENRQYWWSVFVDIWNDPHILDKGAKSSALMSSKFTNDDPIQFNEDNFSAEYPIGMSRQALVEKLDNKRVRIIGEAEYIGNGDDDTDVGYDGCMVETDHVGFGFDRTNHLGSICVFGWPTAKGLKPGDTEEKLIQLYGKDANVQKNAGGDCDLYSYFMNGHGLELQFGDYFHPCADALNFWSVP